MSSLPAVSQQALPATPSLDQDLQRATQILNSGLLPASIKSPQQALVIMWKGREIGLQPLQSFAHLYVVNGQVAMDTKLMYALYESRGHAVSLIESTDKQCSLTFHLRDGRKFDYTLTMAEAQAAHWHQNWNKEQNCWEDKPTWKSMPRIMLRYAAMRTGIRAYAPGCLFGMLTIDEAESTPTNGNEDLLAESLNRPDIIEGTTHEVPQEPAQAPAEATAPAAPATPPPPAPQGDNGNEPKEIDEEDLSPVAFQRAFFAWLNQAGEYNKLQLTGKPLYEALKRTGKMKPHLRNYTKLEFAQADALLALAEIKRIETGAGK